MSPRPWIAAAVLALVAIAAPARAGELSPCSRGTMSTRSISSGSVPRRSRWTTARSGCPGSRTAISPPGKVTRTKSWPSSGCTSGRATSTTTPGSGQQRPPFTYPGAAQGLAEVRRDSASERGRGGRHPDWWGEMPGCALAPTKDLIKPVGAWNLMEVTCMGGTITCKLNGREISKGTGSTVESGPIGWQSEGAPIRFRKIMIRK